MTERVRSIFVMSAAVLLIAGVGCAKRPSVTVASAPPPTAPAAPAPAPAPAPPPAVQPPAPAPVAPAPAPAPTPVQTARPAPAEFKPADLKAIHFDFDKSDIRPEDAKILEGHAVWLRDNAKSRVLIEGHCDERGTSEYNFALGERRARSAMNFLVAQGIAASRITVISYGEERPLCTEKTEACWAQNRRDMFLVKPE